MSLRIECITIDCNDLATLTAFWANALGYERVYEDAAEVALRVPGGDERTVDVLLLRVPDGKQGKNRLHLDLRPGDHAVEVARLEGLGATRVDIGQEGDESWVVMADPEGNEFTVVLPLPPELAAQAYRNG